MDSGEELRGNEMLEGADVGQGWEQTADSRQQKSDSKQQKADSRQQFDSRQQLENGSEPSG